MEKSLPLTRRLRSNLAANQMMPDVGGSRAQSAHGLVNADVIVVGTAIFRVDGRSIALEKQTRNKNRNGRHCHRSACKDRVQCKPWRTGIVRTCRKRSLQPNKRSLFLENKPQWMKTPAARGIPTRLYTIAHTKLK